MMRLEKTCKSKTKSFIKQFLTVFVKITQNNV